MIKTSLVDITSIMLGKGNSPKTFLLQFLDWAILVIQPPYFCEMGAEMKPDHLTQ